MPISQDLSKVKRYFYFFKENPVWSKVIVFSLTLFLIQVSDAIISFWAPNQSQNLLGSPFLMGLIISFQSLVGFLADLTFPSLLKYTKVRRLLILGIATSALTSFFLVASIIKPFALILLITMSLWGIYYELIAFANYQFMGSSVPLHMRSAAWGVEAVFVNLAYFIGPLLAAFILLRGYMAAEVTILILLFAAFVLIHLKKHIKDPAPPIEIDLRESNPFVELSHWLSLTKIIWPAMIISLLLGFIDSTFWTTGATWTVKLAETNSLGGFFLSLYQLPAIFLGIAVAKWGIYKGKKILAEKVLILAGLFLGGMAFSDNIPWQLLMVFLSSSAVSICYPLIQGVYSDIVARMGKEKKDMIGLTSSVINISYMVWPPIAGYITLKIGERLTFSVLGIMVVIVAIILLFVTPKKLRLPQEEIKSWS